MFHQAMLFKFYPEKEKERKKQFLTLRVREAAPPNPDDSVNPPAPLAS
jgi:hypothetical protein